LFPIEGGWYPVPPKAVIKTENPVGEAIVWYLPNQAGPEGDLPRSDWYKNYLLCTVGRRLISIDAILLP